MFICTYVMTVFLHYYDNVQLIFILWRMYVLYSYINIASYLLIILFMKWDEVRLVIAGFSLVNT